MSSTLPRLSPVIVLLLAASPAFGVDMERHGIIERPATGDFTCSGWTHFITDPCTGQVTFMSEFMTDLDPYVCTYSIVDGPSATLDCTFLQAVTVDVTAPACSTEPSTLVMTGGPDPQARWPTIPCAQGQDLIRVDLPGLAEWPSLIDLGTVVCLADDLYSSSAPWGPVTGPPDADTPASGAAFIYLARGDLAPYGGWTYGWSTSGKERLPGEGDCPD